MEESECNEADGMAGLRERGGQTNDHDMLTFFSIIHSFSSRRSLGKIQMRLMIIRLSVVESSWENILLHLAPPGSFRNLTVFSHPRNIHHSL